MRRRRIAATHGRLKNDEMDGTTYHTPQGGDAGRFRCGALPAVVCLLSGGRPGYLLREYSHGDQIRPLRRRRARNLYPLAASLRLRCRGPFRAGDSLRRADPDVAFFASRRRLHAADAGQRRKSAGVRSRRPDARVARNGTGGPRANTSMPTNCIGACAACMWTDRDSRRLRPT